jgi:hypothetical protein
MFKFQAMFLIASFLCGPSAATEKDKPIKAADVPREFRGTFEWKDMSAAYDLILKIEKIAEKDGVIRFSGTHSYTPGEYVMKIEGTIDPKSRRISIFETEVLAGGGDLDGSFAGTISADLTTLEAMWTSDTSGKRGDLKVKAQKSK